jgi:hypothetical protein
MSVIHQTITLSSASATQVGPTPRHAGCDITIQNTASVGNVYIGNGSVTTTNYGFRIDPGSAWSVELSQHDTLFAATDTDGLGVAVLRLDLEQGT